MKMFIKRFWGFDPIYWPVVAFSQRGSLDTLLAQAEPGDCMAFVGTQGPNTAVSERGRLLGFVMFGRERIHSRAALPPQSFADAAKGPNGDIKWPHAVAVTAAWKFTDTPLPVMTEILRRQLPMAAMNNAVLLTSEEQARVLGLPRQEIDVATTQAILDERTRLIDISKKGGTTGPIPSSFDTSVSRDVQQPASTYAFRFGQSDIWKIGWADDPAKRLRVVNKHIPYELLGQRWEGGLTQKWASAPQVYAMEQAILASFREDSRHGERIRCSKGELDAAWLQVLRGG